jgi:integrase
LTVIHALWATLKCHHSAHADARRTQILTMASPRDVCGMRWQDIDLQQAIWTVSGRDLAPLTKPMLDMLSKVQHRSGISQFVFCDESKYGPVPSEVLCFGAADIRMAFDRWATITNCDTAQGDRAVLEAWAAYVMGAAHV